VKLWIVAEGVAQSVNDSVDCTTYVACVINITLSVSPYYALVLRSLVPVRSLLPILELVSLSKPNRRVRSFPP
jgi:hypothetical protein